MKNITTLFLLLLFMKTFTSCEKKEENKMPNVILIMADDMGYECLNTYEETQYKTPRLNQLAKNAIQFANCHSQPLCTPSRVKIMTGLHNYENYDHFGRLNTGQYTFGNLMKDAGYETMIAGKWQLNGLAYKKDFPDWNSTARPNDFGFDEHCLWQLTKERKFGERFADPLIEQNGKVLERNKDAYGPDIFSNYILDFIDRKKDKPFFVYYPMVLVHDPFVATPDSENWKDEKARIKNDTTYFKDMIAYADKIVGKIADQLKKSNVHENTILIFTGDNGTHPSIYTYTKNGVVRGGKGQTINTGTHVPLLASWPKYTKNGSVFDGIITFDDFFATLNDLVKSDKKVSGKSFLSLLKGEEYKERKAGFIHYDPRWGRFKNQRSQFAFTKNYKLYQDGRFYNTKLDILEKKKLPLDSLSSQEIKAYSILKTQLDNHPKMN